MRAKTKKKTKYTKYTKDKNSCISTHLSGTYQWLSPTQSLLVPWQFQGPEETPSHFPNDSSKVATSQQTLQKHKTIFNKTISLGKWLIPVQPNISMHILYMVCNTLQWTVLLLASHFVFELFVQNLFNRIFVYHTCNLHNTKPGNACLVCKMGILFINFKSKSVQSLIKIFYNAFYSLR